ncbi:MAG: sel1 repeat family protein [Gammaproteobacteria bacterium]|nr:sel1 repeat family protein [Gammaproteobacteria bacterium]
MLTLPNRSIVLLSLALFAGCASHPATPLAFAPQSQTTRGASEPYERLADRLLAGEEVQIQQLQQAWFLTPDLLLRSDVIARPDAAAGLRLTAFAGDLEALAGDAREGAQTAFAPALEQVISSGDGSRAAPWRVTSRSDAEAVLEARGLEVVGGYYHAAVNRPLSLHLMARPEAGAASAEWVFDLSEVFDGIRAAHRYRQPGSGYTPHSHIRHLAQLGDCAAITSAAMLILAKDAPGAREAAVERLFTAAASGNQIADSLLADQYWHLAQDHGGEVRERALTEAARGYRRAAGTGFAYAHYRLGDLLIDEGLTAEGIEHLETAAASDHPEGLRLLASLYRDGRDVARDRERTLELYRRLHALGDTSGRYSYAHWALMAADAEPDPKAMAALLANVDAGHAMSIGLLGDLHALGRQRPRDHAAAQDLWRRAAMVALKAGDVATVQAVARSLVHNPESLTDPEFAARVLALAGQPAPTHATRRQELTASSGQATPVPPSPQ